MNNYYHQRHSNSLKSPLLAEQPKNSIMMNENETSESHTEITPNKNQSKLTFIKSRVLSIKSTLTATELSGSLGDLGTFIPLTTALARQRKISLAPSLFWAGICNIISGIKWDVPMCVQPMKSIAAVALSGDAETGGLDAISVTTAGILTGGVVLFLGVTNLIELVNAIVPETVVCGIQVGVGIRLASKGMNDVMDLSWAGGYDCIALAIGCALISLFWLRENDTKDTGSMNVVVCSNDQNPEVVVDLLQSNTESASGEHAKMGQCTHSDSQQSSLHIEQMHSTTIASSEQKLSLQSEPKSSLHQKFTSQFQLQQLQLSQNKSLTHKIWKKLFCCLNVAPSTPHPIGIYLFLIGSIFATITLATAGPDSGYDLPLHFFGAPIAIHALKGVVPADWRIGFFRGTVPQLPLTTLNSVISVCCLAHQLYPEKRGLNSQNRSDAVISRREVSISVGLMNLLLCPLGSMPNCHGAGGLAGQHRFGARHGTSVMILGLFKVLLAVFFGGSALTLLDALPVAVLGVMVTIAGLELVGTGVGMLVGSVEKIKEKMLQNNETMSSTSSTTILRERTLVAMVTASVIIATARTDYGALAGWIAHAIYGSGFVDFVAWVKQKRSTTFCTAQ